MNDTPDQRPPARRSRPAPGFNVERALVGWFLLGVGALTIYLLFMPLFGEMLPWKVAWAAAIVLSAGIAFRAGHWFQKREQRRRAGRKAHRRRAPWSVHRCLAMMFTGASLFVIGWAQVLFPTFHDFILGMIICWTSFLGWGGGALLVGAWELHRRVHARDLEAAVQRRRVFAHWGVVLWGATSLAALGCALLFVLVVVENADGISGLGVALLLLVALVIGSVLVGAVLRTRAAVLDAERPQRARRVVPRTRPRRAKRRRTQPGAVLEWIGNDRAQ